MSWVIKAGPEDEFDCAEYLHAWDTDSARNIVDVKWIENQRHAHRFADRNAAARTAESFPICAYADNVRIVKIGPEKPTDTSCEVPK